MDKNEYTIGKLLGKGNFGEVREALYDGERYAIKLFDYQRLKSYSIATINREFNIVNLLQSDAKYPTSLMRVYKIDDITYQKKRYLILLMELVEGHTLYAYVNCSKKLAYDPLSNKFRMVAKKLLEAIAFLHSKNVVHRDIKLINVIYNANGMIKLVDFGFSCFLDEKVTLYWGDTPTKKTVSKKQQCNFSSKVGTLNYYSPELLNREHNAQNAKASDIWAFGVTMYTLVTKRYPYTEKSNISQPYPPFECDDSILKKVIEKSLLFNWRERYTADELLKLVSI